MFSLPCLHPMTCSTGVFGVDTVSDLLTGVLSGRVKTQVMILIELLHIRSRYAHITHILTTTILVG